MNGDMQEVDKSNFSHFTGDQKNTFILHRFDRYIYM